MSWWDLEVGDPAVLVDLVHEEGNVHSTIALGCQVEVVALVLREGLEELDEELVSVLSAGKVIIDAGFGGSSIGAVREPNALGLGHKHLHESETGAGVASPCLRPWTSCTGCTEVRCRPW